MIRLVFILLAAPLIACAGSLPFRQVADIPLSGHASRFDYASLDPETGLLFIAHLGDSEVVAYDVEKGKVVATIPGIDRVHGVLAVPETGKVYASATASNEIVAIDEKTLKVVARMPAGVYPDGMAYAPGEQKLYVSDEHGNTETVIDTRSNRRISTLRLESEVGNSQYDPVSGHVFVNAQTLGRLIEIDPETDKIVGRHELAGCDGPHGLLIDSAERIAFVACQDNDRLLALDMKTMRVVSSFGVGKDPDVLAMDPGLHRLYVAGEQGVVSVFDLSGGARKTGEGFVGDNAHVVTVDPATHRLYFPLKNVGGFPVLRIMQ